MYFVIAVYTLICIIFGVFVYGLLFKSGTNGEEYTKDSSQIVQRIIYSFVIVSLISVKLYLSYLIIRLFSFFQYERIKRNIKTPDKKTQQSLGLKLFYILVFVIYAGQYLLRIGMLVG